VILAGDIGGTNARLALFTAQNGTLLQRTETVFPSRQHSGLDQIVAKFVAQEKPTLEAACFGIAGPVVNGRCETSNLPWVVEADQLARELGLPRALLINDLEANAWGIGGLAGEDLVSLNHVSLGSASSGATSASPVQPTGNQAVVSAGTGLGEAGLYWDGTRHHVFACEGGHTDFAPRNDLEVQLLQYLVARFGHVSYERILSGPGLVNVFSFLRDSGHGRPEPWLVEEMEKSDPAATISKAALQGKCELCEQALELFISIYGAEAGNMALKVMATGGIFLGGGIAPKILARLKGPIFMDAFRGKGRMQRLLESIPVSVIVNDKTALLGAARCAQARLATEIA
jgi:glucokinase